MDLQLRQAERDLGNPYAFRHKRRIQTAPRVKSQNQKFGEFFRIQELVSSITWDGDHYIVKHNSATVDDLCYAPITLDRRLTFPMLYAIHVLERGAARVSRCLENKCKSLARTAGYSLQFLRPCYDCLVSQYTEFPESGLEGALKQITENHAKFKENGFCHESAGLMAMMRFYIGPADNTWPIL